MEGVKKIKIINKTHRKTEGDTLRKTPKNTP